MIGKRIVPRSQCICIHMCKCSLRAQFLKILKTRYTILLTYLPTLDHPTNLTRNIFIQKTLKKCWKKQILIFLFDRTHAKKSHWWVRVFGDTGSSASPVRLNDKSQTISSTVFTLFFAIRFCKCKSKSVGK
jgi:hypothetical protein